MTNRSDKDQELQQQVQLDSFSAHTLYQENTEQGELIRPATQIGAEIEWPAEQVIANPTTLMPESEINSRPKLIKNKWLWLTIAIFGLAGVELVLFVDQMFNQQDWLSAAWLLVTLGILLIACKQLYNEWRGLAKLKQHNLFKQQAVPMLSAPTIGQGQTFCEQLIPDFQVAHPQAIERWQQALQPHHLDSEVLTLFDSLVVREADQKALKYVTKNASACAAMIAVSPFALLDMGVVLWRNLVMLRQISECYGIHLTYFGRIRLVKSVFKTMLVAGAAEIISDAGNYALGAGITGKLSSRLAQGLGAGVLTTRIGVKAMQACRPMPWLASKPPGISKLAQQLLDDLKKLSP
jgi:putative membrane protein